MQMEGPILDGVEETTVFRGQLEVSCVEKASTKLSSRLRDFVWLTKSQPAQKIEIPYIKYINWLCQSFRNHPFAVLRLPTIDSLEKRPFLKFWFSKACAVAGWTLQTALGVSGQGDQRHFRHCHAVEIPEKGE